MCDGYLGTLHTKINHCTVATIDSLENADIGSESHMIFHHVVEDYKYHTYRFMLVSDYVRNEVYQTIQDKDDEGLITFTCTSVGKPLWT